MNELLTGSIVGVDRPAHCAIIARMHGQRFIRTIADVRAFLAAAGLQGERLDEDDASAFRQRWRERHLPREVFARRVAGRPRGNQSKRWTYDWEDLADAQPMSFTDARTALLRAGDQQFALFFEAVDLPVLLLSRDAVRALDGGWECDVYLSTWPDPAATVAWNHEGEAIFWSRNLPARGGSH